MGQKTVEILLAAKDLLSDPMRKGELALAAAKLQADALNKSFEKLSRQHPSLSEPEARAAATALNQLGTTNTQKLAPSFEVSKQAASGLAQMVGLQLPESVTTFLSKTSTIGPALSAAFTTVGVLGLIGAVGQLPALYDKLKAAISGWDKTAQDAYQRMIDANHKAEESIVQLQIRMNDALGKGSAANVEIVEQKIDDLQKSAKGYREELDKIEKTALMTEGFAGDVAAIEGLKAKLKNVEGELQKYGEMRKKLLDDAAVEATTLARQHFEDIDRRATEFEKNQIETRKKNLAAIMAFEEQAGNDVIKRQQEFNNLTFAGGDAVKEGLAEADRMAKQIIANYKDLIALEQQAGDEFIKNQQFWDNALQEFRNRTFGGGDDVKAGEAAAEKKVEAILKGFKTAEDKGRQLINTFADDISHMFTSSIANGKGFWQAFKDQGKNAIAALADTFLSTMIKGFLDPFAKKLGGLVFGGAAGGGTSGSATGAATGGLLGGISSKSLTAFATNPFTLLGVGGAIGLTALFKSQAHWEANSFVRQFQNPFGSELERILSTTASAQDKLKSVESAWLDFSNAAQEFASHGSDESKVVAQALNTLNPLISNIRSDLNQTASNIQAVSPAGPQTIVLQLDGKTFATLTLPYFNAKIRNQNWIFAGAR